MNDCKFVGRIAKEVEVKESENGKKYGYLTVAVPRSYKNADGEYETDFINCKLFGGVVENTNEYCKVGDLIAVKGRVESYSYDKEDGTKKFGQDIVVDKVSFLASSKVKEDIEQKQNSEMEI